MTVRHYKYDRENYPGDFIKETSGVVSVRVDFDNSMVYLDLGGLKGEGWFVDKRADTILVFPE